ncbi:MAG: hypothetical protein Q7R39_05305 [Dehalococcoidia bacterium]|nr:hypothetical protein [Dehalococcoidia bacterium]
MCHSYAPLSADVGDHPFNPGFMNGMVANVNALGKVIGDTFKAGSLSGRKVICAINAPFHFTVPVYLTWDLAADTTLVPAVEDSTGHPVSPPQLPLVFPPLAVKEL